MSFQECALYGDLVLYLRDCAAELLAQSNPETNVEDERTRLDDLIRAWFFAPQDDLHSFAPRDVIWAEQRGEPNCVPDDQLDDLFFDDCLICQAMRKDAQAELDKGHDHGWNWYYDDGGYPLIARYDPEGWDARWANEDQAQQDAISPTPDDEIDIDELDWRGMAAWRFTLRSPAH